jgi:hypothetical protein
MPLQQLLGCAGAIASDAAAGRCCGRGGLGGRKAMVPLSSRSS